MNELVMTDKSGIDWGALKEKTRIGIVQEPSERELDAVFAERAVALSRKFASSEAEAAGRTLLAFTHGTMTFAVELGSVLRVLGKRRVYRIPGAPRHLDRVFYESGRIVSAVSPSQLFASDDDGEAESVERIVLLDHSGTWLGIRAARVLGPRHFADGDLGKPSAALASNIAPCVRGIADDLTIILDGAALVERLRQKVKE